MHAYVCNAVLKRDKSVIIQISRIFRLVGTYVPNEKAKIN